MIAIRMCDPQESAVIGFEVYGKEKQRRFFLGIEFTISVSRIEREVSLVVYVYFFSDLNSGNAIFDRGDI
jgi:hypothetical protein